MRRLLGEEGEDVTAVAASDRARAERIINAEPGELFTILRVTLGHQSETRLLPSCCCIDPKHELHM